MLPVLLRWHRDCNWGVGRHKRWLLSATWLLALAVALSRVVLGVHFPSDVVAGMLVGAASATLVWRLSLQVRLIQRHKRLKQRLQPQIS